ncbi:HEAT repeat domain-containing protein [Streptomyces adelaidensis]|uniref:HEAT repeat domain-containing protein n=1 Tax=Streptomyces adelaidensis TaxID=2796465 RepID=UPI001907D852|nr:HEAT repeat domain-containing protein [Streptomyces adelaidensis]
MDKGRLTEELSGSHDHTRPARDALVEQGAAVAAVLEVLCDEGSPVDWSLAADVLCRIGEPAFPPLTEAIAKADSPEVVTRAAWTLGRLEVADVGAYSPLLKHPQARVRENALVAFQRRGEASVGFVGRLIPLLGDPEPEVRQRAVQALTAIGTGAVPELRRLRQRPATGPRIRSGALVALAAIGGPAALSPVDQDACRRLTRIKRPAEIPEAMHRCTSWYAVPGSDRAAILEAFDLSDPEPVTLRTGAAAWEHDQHHWLRDRPHPHTDCARVFVSPELDGWTLVFGNPSQDTHRIDAAGDHDAAALAHLVRRRCADLSRRFGTAQWYGSHCRDNWTAWCIAEDGKVVRHYDLRAALEDGDEGPAHPAEAGYLLPHDDGMPEDIYDDEGVWDSEAFTARYNRVKDELRIPDMCYANDIAARLSVDPGALGPHTRVTGSGVLTLTACGREHGHPAGALPIRRPPSRPPPSRPPPCVTWPRAFC